VLPGARQGPFGRGGAGGQQASADPRNGIAFGSAPRRFPFLPVQAGTATAGSRHLRRSQRPQLSGNTVTPTLKIARFAGDREFVPFTVLAAVAERHRKRPLQEALMDMSPSPSELSINPRGDSMPSKTGKS
jgi:hypothetical protein